jgi:hypothetical protein
MFIRYHISAEAAFLHNETVLRENSQMQFYKQEDRELQKCISSIERF